jgi:hypothetical protein
MTYALESKTMGRGRKKGTTVVPATVGSWEIIERQFVQGLIQQNGEIYYPTLVEMAEAHNIGYATLRSKMNEGHWMLKREQWQRELHKWVHAANRADYIEAAQRFDATCVQAAQKAMDAIVAHLNEFRANAEPVPERMLDALGRAAVNWQKVGRLSLGLSTENQATKIQQEQQQQIQIDTNLLTEREQDIIDSFLQNIELRKPEISQEEL